MGLGSRRRERRSRHPPLGFSRSVSLGRAGLPSSPPALNPPRIIPPRPFNGRHDDDGGRWDDDDVSRVKGQEDT